MITSFTCKKINHSFYWLGNVLVALLLFSDRALAQASDSPSLISGSLPTGEEGGLVQKVLAWVNGVDFHSQAPLLLSLGALIVIFILYRQVIQRHLGSQSESQSQVEKLRKELSLSASTDPLTGLLNRARAMERIQGEMARCNENKKPLSILVLDLDQFKEINSRQGYLAGDKVLKIVARVLEKTLKKNDAAARWGSKTFLLLAPNTKARSALFLAEKLRKIIQTLKLDHGEKLTVSIGLAQFIKEETVDAWMGRVETALDQARENGGNRSVCNWSRKAPAAEEEKRESDSKSTLLLLKWKDDLSLGHSRIDAQHQSLFDMANQLVKAVFYESPQSRIDGLLDALVPLVQEHFTFEESVMRKNKCPDLNKHVREHKKLSKRLDHLIDRYRTGGLASFILLQFVSQELMKNHLIKTDQTYSTWFQE